MSIIRRPPPYRDAPVPGEGSPPTGVLLVNLGTPDAPTASAVRRYLREFLSDPRVVERPRLLWWLILNLVVLRVAPAGSARRYRKIWTGDGSPLLAISRRMRSALALALQSEVGTTVEVVLGMRYGRPSIADALEPLRREGYRRLLCLALYPQYSGATTGSVFDALAGELSTWRVVPEVRTIHSYHDVPGYIDALSESVRSVWRSQGEAERLLVSFHGLPRRFIAGGDPYLQQCRETAALLRNALELSDDRCPVAFQSRFGREPWIEPATDRLVEKLARSGVTTLDVMTPGFAVDCIETLDEVGRELRETFLAAGGRRFRFIECLNDSKTHVDFLSKIILDTICRWENIAKQ